MVSTERSQQSISRIDALPTWQISRINQRAHRMLVDALAHYGFRGYDYRILTTLEEGGPLSQVAIGQRTGIDRSDIVTALRELEARTLIRRMVDTTDRRRNVVAITPWGMMR
jgi:DNA-binding MarR family transcriptional regulator